MNKLELSDKYCIETDVFGKIRTINCARLAQTLALIEEHNKTAHWFTTGDILTLFKIHHIPAKNAVVRRALIKANNFDLLMHKNKICAKVIQKKYFKLSKKGLDLLKRHGSFINPEFRIVRKALERFDKVRCFIDWKKEGKTKTEAAV